MSTLDGNSGMKRMNATTIELDSSHVSLVSHPKEVADLILLAAGHNKSR